MDAQSAPTARSSASVLSGDATGLSRLYTAVLRSRDVLLSVLAASVLLLADGDPRYLALAAGLLVVVLPYNVALRHAYVRTGRVPGAMAWGDQVLVAAFVLAWPELLAPALVLAMLDIAVAAVMLDRRQALRGAAVGGLLVLGVVTVASVVVGGLPRSTLLAAPAFCLCSATTAYMVGTVAGRERRGQQQLAALLESLPVIVYEMDAETLEVLYLSPHITTLTGRPPSDYLGQPAEFLGMVHREDQRLLTQMVEDLTVGRQMHDTEYRVFTPTGEQRWVRNIASTETGPEGRRLLRGSISDITAQKLAEAALAQQARSDALTALPNRIELLDHVGRALEAAELSVVVFLDVDAFKRINDSLGHGAGDSLLVQIAARLRAALREDDHVARLGGDEFVVLARPADTAGAEAVVRRVLSAFVPVFEVEGRSVRVTASAGAHVVGAGLGDEDTAEAVLQGADAAMYAAKATGPGRFSFYDERLRAAALARLDIEEEIRTGLAEGQFSVVYQPILRATDRVLLGHEALVRWQHPRRGLVSPAEFIPVAEQTGQIVELGRWVLQQACRQARRWAEETGLCLRMSVNLSALQLSDDELVTDVHEALARAGLPASALCLEITETALIENPAAALTALRELRARGVTVALDDFGTGYSSLSHLHTYPVDTVKIDRSFVARMEQGDGGIVTAILHLASHMGLTVVAEGVETLAQADTLTALGCDQLQGYALGRPAPAEAVVLPAPGAAVPALTI